MGIKSSILDYLRNMIKNSLLLYGLLALLFATSCNRCNTVDPPEEEDKATFKIQFHSFFGDLPLHAGEVYRDAQNNRMYLEEIRGYVSNITLYDENDSSVVIEDIQLLDWFSNPYLTYSTLPKSIHKIKLGLGVPASLNKNTDPTLYPSTSPLSVSGSSGMFWTWNTGYIFYSCAGKVDLSGSETAAILDPYSYHCGDDTLYREITLTFPTIQLQAGKSSTLDLYFDAKKCFIGTEDTLILSTDFLTHTTGNLDLAIRCTNLYQHAFSSQP